MATEYLTTRELASLLRIKERKVYDLAASGKVPCSKALGKLLFPRAEIEAWIAAGQNWPEFRPPSASPMERQASSRAGRAALRSSERPNVVLGSHDPLLEWALRESGSGLAAYFDGSGDGLRRFEDGEGLAAGLHVFDSSQREWNLAPVVERFCECPVVLVEWARRQRGLIIGQGVSSQIGGLQDLAGLRIAARQPGAGAQQLFHTLAAESGLNGEDINETLVLRSETDVALAVLENKADVSFGLQSLAAQYKLAFVPILEERYDLLVDRRAWFELPMQTLLRFCSGAEFSNKASELVGYDVSGLGRVHYNGQ